MTCCGRIARLVLLLAAVPVLAMAQLQVQLTPEGEGAKEAAQVGYANDDGVSGGQVQLALRYAMPASVLQSGSQIEPYVGLSVADGRTLGVDTKAVHAGFRYVWGSGYVDTGLTASVDRLNGGQFQTAKTSAIMTPEQFSDWFSGAQMKGWFIRPKFGAYYEHRRDSENLIVAPNGGVTVAWLGLNIAYSSHESPQNSLSYRTQFTHDLATSGDRSKEHFRYHNFAYTRLFYNPLLPKRPGETLLSLTVERRIGADPINVSRERHSATAVYLGIEL